MRCTEFGPGERDHAARAVELHCAAAEGNHGMHEPKIFGRQVEDVTEHLGLGVVLVEHGMVEILGCAPQRRGDGHPLKSRNIMSGDGRSRCSCGEHVREHRPVHRTHALVQCDTNMAPIDVPQIDARRDGRAVHNVGVLNGASDVDSERVEEVRVDHLEAKRLHGVLERLRKAVNLVRDLTEADRAVVDRVHGGHVGEERLARADVAGRFLAANVLLPSYSNMLASCDRWVCILTHFGGQAYMQSSLLYLCCDQSAGLASSS